MTSAYYKMLVWCGHALKSFEKKNNPNGSAGMMCVQSICVKISKSKFLISFSNRIAEMSFKERNYFKQSLGGK